MIGGLGGLMAQLMTGYSVEDELDRFVESKAKPTKQCLHCGKDHQHNNTCCSAECFKAWKADR